MSTMQRHQIFQGLVFVSTVFFVMAIINFTYSPTDVAFPVTAFYTGAALAGLIVALMFAPYRDSDLAQPNTAHNHPEGVAGVLDDSDGLTDIARAVNVLEGAVATKSMA